MDRSLVLHRGSSLFFDDLFSQMEGEIAHMHHDMCSVMFRLEPFGLTSKVTSDLDRRWQELRNVYSVAEDGSRNLDVTLDMSNFKLEEIEVKVANNKLSVQAKHEEDEHSCVKHEFHREFLLPEGTDLEKIRSSLSKDGILSIKGPVTGEAKALPITKE